MNSTGFDPENDVEVRYASKFQKEISARIQKAVDAKIAALAEVHLVPRVGEMIERANMVKTNQYGEAKSPPMTFKEYIAHRAEEYMAESVDSGGKSKAEANDYHNWRADGPRLTVLMKTYIRETLDNHAKAALSDVNKAIAMNIQKAASEAIAKAAAALKVSVSN